MAQTAPILVAEDEETDVLLLQIALKKAGLATELIVARDGQEAVDYLSSAAVPPGLLLLDLKMPRLNGFDVLAWLETRPELKSLPVVVLSSSSLDTDTHKALAMGAREYLVKPHGLQALVQLLQDVHARYLCSGAVPAVTAG
ncbi:MAG TPA: response regulator [Candidatus Sulfotelmatobacter sp.]|nr:response regulator [Candidatus Sulfotelmatobacter sp.]